LLAKEGLSLIEEWGMLSVKTAEIAMKTVLKLIDTLLEN
jgi:hypothetical protein